MFKKGQLVKTGYNGYGVIRHVSDRLVGLYLITNPYWSFGMWYRENELTLIGNNFKFKGAK